eukprot:448125-Pyramimonas_sp.AAC.1
MRAVELATTLIPGGDCKRARARESPWSELRGPEQAPRAPSPRRDGDDAPPASVCQRQGCATLLAERRAAGAEG